MKWSFKLKFHLSPGKNYRYWQIRDHSHAKYFNPELYSLVLSDCYLKNQPSQAQKVLEGAYRMPIAYVYCQNYEVVKPLNKDSLEDNYHEIFYNPKKKTHWYDIQGNNIDNQKYSEIITLNRKVFAINDENNYSPQQLALF